MQHQLSTPPHVFDDLPLLASSANHLVGDLDDDLHANLVGHLAEDIDAVVHGPTEILGDPRALVVPGAAATDVTLHGAPMLAFSVGGAS